MSLDSLLQQVTCDFFWIPSHARIVDRTELCHAFSDKPGWDNHVARLTLPQDLDIEQADHIAAEVESCHRHGHSRYFIFDEWMRAPMMDAIENRGLTHSHSHRAAGLNVAEHQAHPTGDFIVEPVQTLPQLLEADALASRVFGSQHLMDEDEARQLIAQRNRGDYRIHRFIAQDRRTGESVAHGGLNIYPELKMGLMWGGGTIPEARGRGAYRATVDARIAFARVLGLDTLALYAREGESLPIMQALGADLGNRMHFWDRPPSE
jgi:hypothetical protein